MSSLPKLIDRDGKDIVPQKNAQGRTCLPVVTMRPGLQWLIPFGWHEPLPHTPYVIENERMIEVPLALTACKWTTCPGLILDAGCGLNRPELYRWLKPAGRVWHYTQSLALEMLQKSDHRVSYLCGDLRQLELADATCEQVVCLSTLEHVGMNTGGYRPGVQVEAGDWRTVIAHLWRALKPSGNLFLSFPAGVVPNSCEYYRAFTPDDVAEMEAIIGLPFIRRYFVAEPVGSWYDSTDFPPMGLEPPKDKQKPVGLACLRAQKPCAS